MSPYEKYGGLVDRLTYKMTLSQTPIPGFIISLSGTDSILTFLISYTAMEAVGIENRLLGIHYVNEKHLQHDKKDWFEAKVLPWLREKCPHAKIQVETPLGGNQDQQRWADLHLRALFEVNDGKVGKAYETGRNYWVVGTMNATEKALGTYSVLSNCASIQPIQSLYKGTVLEICKELGVPQIALERSRIPDCLCGRDELAAKNIEVIDSILRHDFVYEGTLETLKTLLAYVHDTKQVNDFKSRIPYIP